MRSAGDVDAELLGWLRAAGDLILLAQTEVAEVREQFGGGSSSMPQKSNSTNAILTVAAARRAPGLVSTLLTTLVQEHERAAGSWHAEWATVSELLAIAGGAAAHCRAALDGLVVDEERMQAHVAGNDGLMAEAVAARLGRSMHGWRRGTPGGARMRRSRRGATGPTAHRPSRGCARERRDLADRAGRGVGPARPSRHGEPDDRRCAARKGGSMDTDSDERGMRVRREVLGDDHVDRAIAATDPFTADFQALITRYAWGDVWARPGLDRRTRSCVTLALLSSLGSEEEFEMHLAAAVRNGVTREEITEVLLHVAVYAGVPRANRAFAIAQAAFRSADAQG